MKKMFLCAAVVACLSTPASALTAADCTLDKTNLIISGVRSLVTYWPLWIDTIVGRTAEIPVQG